MRPTSPLLVASTLAVVGLALPHLLDGELRAEPGPAPERVFVGADSEAEPARDPTRIDQRDPPPPPPEDKLVQLGPAFAIPSLPLSESLREALNEREYGRAVGLVKAMDAGALEPANQADHAFLLAWLQVHQGDAEQAAPSLERISGEGAAPAPYIAMVKGEILLAVDEALQAVGWLEQVEAGSAAIWPRAHVQLAEAYYALERTADSRRIYQGLIAREDPSDGGAMALLTAAQRAGLGSDEAYPLLRRLWREYPRSAEARQAEAALQRYEARGGTFRPSGEDKAARADALMAAYRYQDAIQLLQPMISAGGEPSPALCRAWYVYGRSQYRLNRLSEAHEVLATAGQGCAEHDQDRGAKALYLAGKAKERRKEWAAAALLYERIPALYPEHSMADDGYALAGIGYQESDAPALAMERWASQVLAYPDGDMAGEGFWRLAWNSYLAGDTPAAVAWADQAVERLDLATDPVHYRAAKYWRWRWRLYPRLDDPSALVEDPEQRDQAIEGLLALCRDHPASYYALLAAARLQELAPERLAALPHPALGEQAGAAWRVRQSFLEQPAASNALALARVGLVREAVVELEQLDESEMAPGEIGVFTDLMVDAGQWLWAHDRLRRYLNSHPPETLASDRGRLLSSAYMRRYEGEVQTACAGYPWDYRLFHALVREESNFNERIVSHAGARGLSQLMPATARSVAGWLGSSVSDAGMFVPSTNLRIGGRYLHHLMERYGNDPFLSLAGYNAGPGNVGKWLEERGNRPVDEFVESIPFRETRHYVKRVSASWQMYHLLYDGGEPFPPLSAFNHQAVPD
jgi:soluble lytic murein transglycosylase